MLQAKLCLQSLMLESELPNSRVRLYLEVGPLESG